MEWDTQVCFGWSDAAHLLSRANFVVLHIIEVELEEAQAVFDVAGCGMNAAEQSALAQWTAARQSAGQTTKWWSCLPFFDDNSIACLSLCKKWTGVVENIVDAVWKKYNYQISEAKSAVNYYDNDHWDAILGRILHTRRRQIILPEAKVKRYSKNVDDVLAAAEAHRSHLVDKTAAQQLFGRLLFACDAGVPSIWRDFIALMSCVCSSWSSHWIQLGQEARDILKHIQWKLHFQNGVAFTGYTPRPLEDGRPVVITYTDASQKSDTLEAGYGGFLYKYPTNTTDTIKVFFFVGKWTEYECSHTDINELEGKTAGIAAACVDQVLLRCGDIDESQQPGAITHDSGTSSQTSSEFIEHEGSLHGLHYVVQFGDFAVFFEQVMPNASASSHGLCFLYRNRAAADATCKWPRLTITQHIERGLNQASDDLSNSKVAEFKQEIYKLLGTNVVFEQ
jgi:hypothetical protein